MIETTLRAVARAFGLIGMLGMFAMVIHVTADVIGRLIFNHPLPATLEMTAHYYMVAVVFFPLAGVEFRNGHISVELVSQHLRANARRILIAVASLLGVAYFALLTWRTGHDAFDKWEIGEYLYGTWPIRIWPTRIFVPLGCGLLGAVLLWKALALLRGEDRLLAEGAETLEGLETEPAPPAGETADHTGTDRAK